MSKWIKQFLLAGLAGLIRPKHNQKYSLETKLTAVKAYLSGKYTNQAILQQYQIGRLQEITWTNLMAQIKQKDLNRWMPVETFKWAWI